MKGGTANMISAYNGDYRYNRESVSSFAPESIGVYYCLNSNRTALYVGKSTTSIRDRLLCHLRDDNWSDVALFGYKICSNWQEATNHEATEIERLKPKYNTAGKTSGYL